MKERHMVRISLDFGYGDSGETFEEGLHDFLKDTPDVYVRVMNPRGPAGGLPDVEFMGPRNQIEAIARKYGEPNGEEEVRYLIESIYD